MYVNEITMGGKVKFIRSNVTASGTIVTSFNVSVCRKYKEDWQWTGVDVVSFGKQAEWVKDNIIDGDFVLVQGELKEDTWEKDGVKHRKLSIIASRVSPYAKAEKAPRSAQAVGVSTVVEDINQDDALDAVPW
jgi:single-strand DNA-binding protein